MLCSCQYDQNIDMQPDNVSVAALLVDNVHERLALHVLLQDGQKLLQRLNLRTDTAFRLLLAKTTCIVLRYVMHA